MPEKIIYVSILRLTAGIARDWCIDAIRQNGVAVEYWDISGALRGHFEEPHAIEVEYLRRFDLIRDIKCALAEIRHSNVMIVVLVPLEARYLSIFLALARHRLRTVQFLWGLLPLTSTSPSNALHIYLTTPGLLLQKIFDRTRLNLAKRFGMVRPADIVYAAGDVAISMANARKRVVPINMIDYDHFVHCRDTPAVLKSDRYAVFLDINLPYHSDLELCGWETVTPAQYEASMCRFFALIEKQYGVRVVIAAHPKSNYAENAFEGRLKLRDQTPILVRDAELVITHTSTALSYAVLNYKPVVFVYTQEMAKIYQFTIMKYLRDFADYFKTSPINVDQISENERVLINAPDREIYDRYKFGYLTSRESEMTSTPKRVLEGIRSLVSVLGDR